MANVKSVPSTPKLSKKLSPEYDLCTDEGDESKIPASSSSAQVQPANDLPDLQGEIKLLQKAILAKRKSERDGTKDFMQLKHYYNGGVGSVTITNDGFIGSLNSIAQGTTNFTRIGDAINQHGITIRLMLRYEPIGTSQTLANWVPPVCRLVVWRNSVPDNVPPLITDLVEFTSSVPTSDVSVYTANGSSVPDGMITAFRNPFTFDRNHVYHDEVIEIKNNIWLAGTGAVVVGTWHKTFHIDLHKVKTIYYGSTANLIVTNSLCWAMIMESSTVSPAHITYSYTYDLTFNDADLS